MIKYKFLPHLIFNFDETDSTVTIPPKAQRETKQVEHYWEVTSIERGNLVTVLFMINASEFSLFLYF